MCHLHGNELGAMRQLSPAGEGFGREKGKSQRRDLAWMVGLSPTVRWASHGGEQSWTWLWQSRREHPSKAHSSMTSGAEAAGLVLTYQRENDGGFYPSTSTTQPTVPGGCCGLDVPVPSRCGGSRTELKPK